MYRKKTTRTPAFTDAYGAGAKYLKEQMLLEEQLKLANLMQTPEIQPPQEIASRRAAKMGQLGGGTPEHPMGGVLGMFLQKIMEQHYQNNPPQPLGMSGIGQPVGQPGSMDQDMYPWYMDPGKVRDVY